MIALCSFPNYVFRLKCDDRNAEDIRNHPFWSFRSWSATRVNLLHRLKYLTNAIVEVLEKEDFKPSLVKIRNAEYRYAHVCGSVQRTAVNGLY